MALRSSRQAETEGLDIMATAQTLRGSCLCGLVAYEVSDSFEYALYCHCSNCRRATGAAAKPFAGISAARLLVTHGCETIMRHVSALAHDARCRACGLLLFSLVRDVAWVHVT